MNEVDNFNFCEKSMGVHTCWILHFMIVIFGTLQSPLHKDLRHISHLKVLNPTIVNEELLCIKCFFVVIISRVSIRVEQSTSSLKILITSLSQIFTKELLFLWHICTFCKNLQSIQGTWQVPDQPWSRKTNRFEFRWMTCYLMTNLVLEFG
jgi:hypothetical protein